jgi:membrane complex biogenesis BtpA family protein
VGVFPSKALIGMVHVGALPGTPHSRRSVSRLVGEAVAEAKILVNAGFDAIIIENMHDRPYVHGVKGPEIVAAMTAVALTVREVEPDLPLGIQILSGGNKEALAVALASGAQFIRCENFVFSHVADEGLLDRAEAGELLRYRKAIGANEVRIFADIKKKHASHAITADLSLAAAVEGAEFFSADGVIITGAATGRPTSPGDLAEARRATKLPVLVGSGVTPEQVGGLFEHADGLIVGSFVKRGGRWENGVDAERCRKLVAAARKAR